MPFGSFAVSHISGSFLGYLTPLNIDFGGDFFLRVTGEPEVAGESVLARVAFPTLPRMDDDPIPSILAAVAAGGGRRQASPAWTRQCAQVLSALYEGLTGGRAAQVLALDGPQLRRLVIAACDAVLRGGAASSEADEVCAATFQGWCDGGDLEACERLRPRDAWLTG